MGAVEEDKEPGAGGETVRSQMSRRLPPPAPPRLLTNPHAQTLFAALAKREPEPRYRRERLTTPDGDFLDLDWVDGDPACPALVVIHGFEGSAASPHVRQLASAAGTREWTVVAINLRSCSGEVNRRLGTYHSGETTDIEWIVSQVAAAYPARPVFVVGFSLGGNMLGAWLARQPQAVPDNVLAACLVSSPYDLLAASKQIERPQNRLYLWNFLRSCKAKAKEKARAHPGAFDLERVLAARTLREYDDAFTAPIFGFDDYEDYYRRSSTRGDLPAIQVPTLLLAADDDPIVPRSVLPDPGSLRGTPLELVEIPRGGHLGFLDRKSPNWLARQILHWLETWG